MAFRCKGRHFCPSCHARRVAEWSLWLDECLLAPVAHRQAVLKLSKRLRAYFLHDRHQLGLLSRVAARTLRACVQAAISECAPRTDRSGPHAERGRARERRSPAPTARRARRLRPYPDPGHARPHAWSEPGTRAQRGSQATG